MTNTKASRPYYLIFERPPLTVGLRNGD
ncbi:hypothetical protein OOU_Y34scaffold00651g18 [Pyricularia oryzae Y34]|uniref:Uncharacterized protein n=2 Tax=Pyricularia oryzae TaxID=318829 RepID=A0AA97NUG0_PYRO3|nr:hypothetical protein OOU_Y34scaffold00651g18 [Pyricularia oryzae Y34]